MWGDCVKFAVKITGKPLDRKIRIGAVSYLNTKPLIYGLSRHPVKDEIDLIVDYPAHIAGMLLRGQIDVGLVPVAIIPELKESYIITDYCIGSDGPVDSVAIFSEQPLESINTIILDYQSRTSVMLSRVLMQEYWKKQVTWKDAQGEEFLQQIKDDVAGVVIGDRALKQKTISKYMYDLGLAWKNQTGLPFVFAAWISNKELPEDFLTAFNEANQMGFNNLEEVVSMENYDHSALGKYYTENISYELNAEKRKGLELFLAKMQLLNRTNEILAPTDSRG